MVAERLGRGTMVKQGRRNIINSLPYFSVYFIQLVEETFTTIFSPELFLSASLLFYNFMYLVVFDTYVCVHNVIYIQKEMQKNRERKRGEERKK